MSHQYDHPTDKARYTIRVRVPAGLTVIANGRLAKRRPCGGSTMFVWRETAPMASYLATVDIGHWQIRSGRTRSGIPEYVAVNPQLAKSDPEHPDPLSFFYTTTARITDFWAKKFGRYPFDSTGAIADYTSVGGKPVGFAEESQTRPLFGSVIDEEGIAHELAHQWSGDSVSITDFDDIWLNEGFATWAAWYWDGLQGGIPVAEQVRQKYHD